MASTIQLKRGSGAPTSGDLATGELGLDLTNNRIYSSTDGSDVIEMGIKPTSLAINTIAEGTSGSGVTVDGVKLKDNGITATGTVLTGGYGDVLTTSQAVGIAGSAQAGIHFATFTTGLTATDGFLINVDGSAAYLWQRENSNIYIGTNGVERCNITGSGDFLFGTTSTSPANTSSSANAGAVVLASGQIQAAVDNDSALKLNRYSTDGTLVECRRQGSSVGSITVTTTATAYNTSSDYRLKQDIQPMLNACDRVKALNPINFAWIADGTRVDGFLAHEAQAVVPEAVVGKKDAVDADQNPIYQGIDQSKLVPLLTKALQEALARIEALEAAV
jgi:hypothetical protein